MNKKSFTLIELLVVIAIIAILAAIMLPALSSARNKAYTVKCKSNLKQVHLQLELYGDAYKGYWPPVHNSWSGLKWTDILRNENKIKGNVNTADSILRCPGIKGKEIVNGSLITIDWTYSYNSNISTLLNTTTGKPLPTFRIKRPSRVIIVNDGVNWWTDCWNFDNVASGNAFTSYRHEKVANYLFIDGHVDAARRGVMKQADYQDL